MDTMLADCLTAIPSRCDGMTVGQGFRPAPPPSLLLAALARFGLGIRLEYTASLLFCRVALGGWWGRVQALRLRPPRRSLGSL